MVEIIEYVKKNGEKGYSLALKPKSMRTGESVTFKSLVHSPRVFINTTKDGKTFDVYTLFCVHPDNDTTGLGISFPEGTYNRLNQMGDLKFRTIKFRVEETEMTFKDKDGKERTEFVKQIIPIFVEDQDDVVSNTSKPKDLNSSNLSEPKGLNTSTPTNNVEQTNEVKPLTPVEVKLLEVYTKGNYKPNDVIPGNKSGKTFRDVLGNNV